LSSDQKKKAKKRGSIAVKKMDTRKKNRREAARHCSMKKAKGWQRKLGNFQKKNYRWCTTWGGGKGNGSGRVPTNERVTGPDLNPVTLFKKKNGKNMGITCVRKTNSGT